MSLINKINFLKKENNKKKKKKFKSYKKIRVLFLNN